jgi:thiol peroxidase
MSIERKGSFKFHGQDATIVGADIRVGQKAPEFSAFKDDWSTVRVLESTQGKVRIIGSLPSLNSSVCDRETRRFNQEAASLDENIAIVMLSMDLPWTLRSWCAAAGIDQVLTLSDHKDAGFGEKYGVLLKEPRIFRRSIFVVDQSGQVVYADYMPTNGDEPDYSAVLAAAQGALGKGSI